MSHSVKGVNTVTDGTGLKYRKLGLKKPPILHSKTEIAKTKETVRAPINFRAY